MILYEFLSGWLGGPQLYVEKHGEPRLRARHQPFAIGDAERNQWLLCMRTALDDVVADGELRERLYANLKRSPTTFVTLKNPNASPRIGGDQDSRLGNYKPYPKDVIIALALSPLSS